MNNRTIASYRETFLDYLEAYDSHGDPQNLYRPVSYILGLGGKRLRPVLVLMVADILGADYRKALPAALALEVFHNFSLVHDDIMDEAPLRRGRPTVHEKWNRNTGILSGDAMLIMAYGLFEAYEDGLFKDLVSLFSKTALQVCEGQQYDIDFEQRDDVTLSEYLRMIKYKTAVLISAALRMGAMVAKAPMGTQTSLYDYGLYLGIAFQIKDDYLDAFGNPETFGKQVGGDIMENKKTYLFLKAMELGDSEQKRRLYDLFTIKPTDPSAKVRAVKTVFERTGVAEETLEAIERYTERAFEVLENSDLPDEGKSRLKRFGLDLMGRET